MSGHGGGTEVFYRHDEFGADLLGNQGQFQPFGYIGYQKDRVAGTYYVQAREYDAWSGRFTSEDIIKGNAERSQRINMLEQDSTNICGSIYSTY